MDLQWTILDTSIVAVGALAAVSCALLGVYLMLRRMSMMGDAISHAVLPGLAAAFLIAGNRESLTMLIGAVIVGILTTMLVHTVARFGGLEEGAAMGVVFTSLFAVGLIMIRQAADHVDLDPGCVLNGSLEIIYLNSTTVFGFEVPRPALVCGATLLLNLLFVIVFYKELKVSTFDPALATTMGINANLMHYALMTLVAVTTVAAFEAVGSILVIAMLIVPAATAHLLTDRLGITLVLAVLIAIATAVLGHVGAITIPPLFGFTDASTAGFMGVAAGLLFAVAFLFSPRHGVASRLATLAALRFQIVRDDLLADMFRAQEGKHAAPERGAGLLARLVRWRLAQRGLVETRTGTDSLTAEGLRIAGDLVRSHRLWEVYLVDQAGLKPDHVHSAAERLEHITNPTMQNELTEAVGPRTRDPHDSKIPGQ